MSPPIQRLSLTQEQWDRMRDHVDQCRPEEACGLLAGKDDEVRHVLPISNQDRSSSRFRMDPVEQLRAFNWIESVRLELLGIYHSHPAGPEAGSPGIPVPSATDIADAAYPVAYLIWSRPQGRWQARAFLIQDGRSLEVELLVGRGP